MPPVHPRYPPGRQHLLVMDL